MSGPPKPLPLIVYASQRTFWKRQAYKVVPIIFWVVSTKALILKYGAPESLWRWALVLPVILVGWDFWRAFRHRGPILTLDERGITDERVVHTVPWSQIKAVWKETLQVENYSTDILALRLNQLTPRRPPRGGTVLEELLYDKGADFSIELNEVDQLDEVARRAQQWLDAMGPVQREVIE